MRKIGIVALCFGIGLIGAPSPASSETREDYLARLRAVCEVGCMEPRDLLRTARKRGRGSKADMAAILDIASISRFEDRVRLHTAAFDGDLVTDVLANNGEPLTTNPYDIVIEMDVEIMLQLVALATPPPTQEPPTQAEADPGADAAASAKEIIVKRKSVPRLLVPSLVTLRSLVTNRRVVVRGRPVLTPPLIGIRLDRRRSQLTLVIDSVDDLVLLPRYDDAGNPILDGPLQGLREGQE